MHTDTGIRVYVDNTESAASRKPPPEQAHHLHTVHSEPSFVRVGGAEVVGDDTLVAALVPKCDATEVQNGGVLHHLPVLRADVREVLRVGVGQNLTVLPPGERHGRTAAARC